MAFLGFAIQIIVFTFSLQSDFDTLDPKTRIK